MEKPLSELTDEELLEKREQFFALEEEINTERNKQGQTPINLSEFEEIIIELELRGTDK